MWKYSAFGESQAKLVLFNNTLYKIEKQIKVAYSFCIHILPLL